ncbi:P-loop NTPase [Novispirillum itersonii]|uniref:P-loop NTPase n=1 Tax=Novispirillum itersonii TaxID=189 RepID=UPI00039B94B8|nr:ATP-binding protein [Novispirillum itersonii]
MDPITLALLSVAGAVLKDAVGEFAGDVLKDLAKDLCKEQARSLAGKAAGQIADTISATPQGRRRLWAARLVVRIAPAKAISLLRPVAEKQAAALRANDALLADLRALPKQIVAPAVTLPAPPPGQSAALKAGERHLETRLDSSGSAPLTDAHRHQTRLTFTTRLTGFRGREQEFAALTAFAGDAAAFRWWLVTGNGGAGKSRLALELCLTLAQQGWHTGFLRGSPAPLAAALTASDGGIASEKPVLLVVDYCEQHAEDLRRLIACLHARRGDDLPTVRLLLLARDHRQSWYETTLTGHTDDRQAVEASRHAAPLALPDYDATQAWAMAEGYIASVARLAETAAAPVERDTFLTHARAADPALRPLAVLLLADGPAHGIPLASGTPAPLMTLLEDHLARLEQRYWQGVNVQHRTLLCAATLFRGLPATLLTTPWPGLEKALPYGEDYDPAQYRHLSGSGDADTVLAPLQPDLLGEYYVLATLHRRSTGAFDLQSLLLTARPEPPAQEGAILFAHLCTRDFAAINSPTAQGLIPAQAAADLLLAIHPKTRDLTLLKARVTANAIGFYANAERPDLCQAFLNALTDARTAHPEDTDLRLAWAVGTYNMINALGAAGDLPAATALLNTLTEARTAHPEDADLRLEWARGAFNMITSLGSAGDLSAATTQMNALTDAYTDHPDEAELRLRWARGAVNMINALGTAGDIPDAAALMDALTNARTAHPEDAELRLRWAQGAANIIIDLGTAGDLPAAAALLNALTEARTAAPEDTELRLAWARGTVNMILTLSSGGNIPAVTALLTALISAHTAAPEDTDLRLTWAKGAVNVAVAYAKSGDFPEALTRLDALLSTPGLPEEFLAQVQDFRQKMLSLLTVQNA